MLLCIQSQEIFQQTNSEEQTCNQLLFCPATTEKWHQKCTYTGLTRLKNSVQLSTNPTCLRLLLNMEQADCWKESIPGVCMLLKPGRKSVLRSVRAQNGYSMAFPFLFSQDNTQVCKGKAPASFSNIFYPSSPCSILFRV